MRDLGIKLDNRQGPESMLTADEFMDFYKNVKNSIISSGQELNSNDDDQITKAIKLTSHKHLHAEEISYDVSSVEEFNNVISELRYKFLNYGKVYINFEDGVYNFDEKIDIDFKKVNKANYLYIRSKSLDNSKVIINAPKGFIVERSGIFIFINALTIDGVSISNNNIGIYMYIKGAISLYNVPDKPEQNLIFKNFYTGILASHGTSVFIKNSEMYNCKIGISCYGNTEGYIENVKIDNENGDIGTYGMTINDSSNIYINNVYINNFIIGLYAYYKSFIKFTNSNIINTKLSIRNCGSMIYSDKNNYEGKDTSDFLIDTYNNSMLLLINDTFKNSSKLFRVNSSSNIYSSNINIENIRDYLVKVENASHCSMMNYTIDDLSSKDNVILTQGSIVTNNSDTTSNITPNEFSSIGKFTIV